MNKLISVSDANALIDAGCRLHIAGDEVALRSLHRGTWIGGTIPYFLTPDGGVVDRENVFVTELPAEVSAVSSRLIDVAHLEEVSTEAPTHGFSLVILPGMSPIHAEYALAVEHIPSLFASPIVGWVAGIHLNDLGKVSPKVIDGVSGEWADDRLVVMHATLPEGVVATIGIINVFTQGGGDAIVFDQSGFSGKACTINGKADDFLDYAKRTGLDLKLPLVANRAGEMINVSFQALDDADGVVKFYAPVLKGVEYRQAAPLADYRTALIGAIEGMHFSPAFSCNCILNYLYGGLEGQQSIPVPGPATFGEVGYVLLNQTLVYMSLVKI